MVFIIYGGKRQPILLIHCLQANCVVQVNFTFSHWYHFAIKGACAKLGRSVWVHDRIVLELDEASSIQGRESLFILIEFRVVFHIINER